MNRYADLPEEIDVEVDGAVRVVRLNRPEDGNAVNEAMHRGLVELWRLVAEDSEARSILLTGSGRHFSAGGDMQTLTRMVNDEEARRRMMREAKSLVQAMLGCHLPIVAAVNGAAVGLGCSLVVLSDVVLMSDRAFLADPHVPLGLVAGDGGVLWPAVTSILRAKEYIFTGKRMPAIEAERLGLCNRVVPDASLAEESMTLARELAALPHRALQDTKRALNMHLERAAAGVLEFALAAESECFPSPELQQRVQQFIDR